MARITVWPAVFLALVVACSSRTAEVGTPADLDALALSRDAGGAHGVELVDAAGGHLRSFAHAVAAPDWRSVYSLETGASTSVRALDIRTGAERWRVTLDGRFQLIGAYGPAPTGLSPDGRWLVIVAPGQAETRFAIVDARDGAVRTVVPLPRHFAFDAISDDGDSLYLVEHVVISRDNGLPEPASLDSGTYRVRLYDVSEARLLPTPILDAKLASQTSNDNAQTRADGVMSGIYQSAVTDRDGAWQFSFYFNQRRGPFIHALQLKARSAFCILDLPIVANGWDSRHFWTLALGSDGRSLYAMNGGIGNVTEFDASTLKTLRTATIPGLASARASARQIMNGSVAANDGKRLYFIAEHGVALVDTTDLTLRGHFLKDRALRSIALSADGRRLHALSADDGTVWRIDARTGATLGQTRVDGATGLLGVLAR